MWTVFGNYRQLLQALPLDEPAIAERLASLAPERLQRHGMAAVVGRDAITGQPRYMACIGFHLGTTTESKASFWTPEAAWRIKPVNKRFDDTI